MTEIKPIVPKPASDGGFIYLPENGEGSLDELKEVLFTIFKPVLDWLKKPINRLIFAVIVIWILAFCYWFECQFGVLS